MKGYNFKNYANHAGLTSDAELLASAHVDGADGFYRLFRENGKLAEQNVFANYSLHDRCAGSVDWYSGTIGQWISRFEKNGYIVTVEGVTK